VHVNLVACELVKILSHGRCFFSEVLLTFLGLLILGTRCRVRGLNVERLVQGRDAGGEEEAEGRSDGSSLHC
jgi:hypothetical protein